VTGSDALRDARLSHNGQWMRDRLAEGRKVTDIGPAEGRANFPGVRSDGYSVELYEIENLAYDYLMSPYEDAVALVGVPR